MKKILIITLAAFCLMCLSPSLIAKTDQQHRMIVLTDIGSDPDDRQTLVRLLLYSNQIDIEGLIATTSVWQPNLEPELIEKVIKAYGEVRPNLKQHQEGFPETDELLSKLKQGSPKYGMKGVGKGKNTEGSNWIIKKLEEDDDRPLWISVWGGVNTLAQALYKIDKTKSESEAEKLISKLRVYTISDQDDSAIWIRNNFPDLFYIVSPGDDYGSATWSAINTVVDGIDNEKISNSWLAQNIQQGHGPLGAVYPDVAYGMEGDTPSWLLLIPNGLNNPGHPDWGGWGGRYELYKPDIDSINEGGSDVEVKPETRKIWTNADDSYTPYIHREFGRTVQPADTTFQGNKVTLWRWRDEFQNDFAARMDWCTKSYNEANHPPVPVLSGSENKTVQSGEGIELDASHSHDPDGDNLSFLWFNYPEAGTYNKKIEINSAENMPTAYIEFPHVEKKQTAHFILKVTDKGEPPLTRYKRIIINILSK